MKSLESVTIHQFRGLQNVTLGELGTINLLVGANNSGKTSVLEAIATYCQPLDALAWLGTAGRREVGSSSLPRLDALKWLFPQGAVPGEPEVSSYRGQTRVSGMGRYEVRESHASLEENEGTRPDMNPELADAEALLAKKTEDKDRDQISAELKDIVKRLTWTQLKLGKLRNSDGIQGNRRGANLSLNVTTSAATKLTKTHQLWEDESVIRARGPIQPSLPVATITPFAHRIERLQIQQLSDATMEGFKDTVLDVMRRIDPQVLDLEILAPRGTQSSLYIRHAKVGLAPLTAFGDGVRRTLMYALTLPTVAHGVLLIDELEAAIHVSALGRVFSWLVDSCKRYDVQLFATTHSLEALDAILEAGRADQDQIVGFRLNETQSAPVKRYDGELLHRLRYERGLDIR